MTTPGAMDLGAGIVRLAEEELDGLLSGADRDLIPVLAAIQSDLGEAALLSEPRRGALVAQLLDQARVVSGIAQGRASSAGLRVFRSVVRIAVGAASEGLRAGLRGLGGA